MRKVGGATVIALLICLLNLAGIGCDGRAAKEAASDHNNAGATTSAPNRDRVAETRPTGPESTEMRLGEAGAPNQAHPVSAGTNLPTAPLEQLSNTAILDRVAVIGASATCGFGVETMVNGPHGKSSAPASIAVAVDAVLRLQGPVTSHCSFLFFNDPMAVGPLLMNQAVIEDPTLVFGLDYLFWFGYGHRSASGRAIADEADRLNLLEAGLKQLERLECPVVVGDFPDMRAAIGLMLSARQVPRPETLVLLNARLRDWAADRPNVIIVPLSELVATMSGDAASAKKYIQADQLHPTAEGLVLMVQRAVETMTATDLGLTGDIYENDHDRAMERLRAVIEGSGK